MSNTVASVTGPTPTGIGTTVGRLVAFRCPYPITVATLRFFGLATVSSLYTAALYDGSNFARLWMADPFNVVGGWNAISLSPTITLLKDRTYFFGLGAKNVGTTAGFRTLASPIASSMGQNNLPGNLAVYGVPRFVQATLVGGAWPDPLGALSVAAFASAGSTGTVPMLYLDAT